MTTENVQVSIKKTERGWAGHFICSDRCRFRRNTLLELGQVRIVISSVGLMERLNTENEFDRVGIDRYFETMVFHAEYDGRYWDADISREVSFSSPWAVKDLDADDIANDQHEAVVNEITERMIQGDFIDPDQTWSKQNDN